jgi:glycerol uptake facilitator-like aquaporin
MNTKSNKILIGEILGTYTLFTLIGILSIFIGKVTNNDVVNNLVGALTAFVSLFIAISLFGKLSGGHFNPGVTINQVINGATDKSVKSTYFMGQYIGGVLAVITVVIVVFTGKREQDFFQAKNAIDFTEFLKTIVLEAIVFSIFLYSIAKANHGNIFYNALQIAGTLGLLIFVSSLINYSPTLNLVALVSEILNSIKTFTFGGLTKIVAAAAGQIIAAFIIGKVISDKYDS